MSVDAEALWIVPRARLADSLRAIASLITGVITLLAGIQEPWVLPLAVVLIGYAAALCIKMADKRPAIIATRKGIRIFRFPGASHEVDWKALAEVSWLKMRVKRVLFFKVLRDDETLPIFHEMPSTDFSGKGREVVRRLTEYRDRFA